MSVRMPAPPEADWDRAPSLLDGAMNLELTSSTCNLRYWLAAVPQGTLLGRLDGHAADVTVPDFMRKPGPLYEAITQEYAFRTVAEEKAARALSYLTPLAPDVDTMEFYATRVLDETRHAMVFRNHLVTLGVPRGGLPVQDMVHQRDLLFQQGLEQHAEIVGDYEIWPGRRLVDTTPAQRQQATQTWSVRMKETRLRYMGLEEAIG